MKILKRTLLAAGFILLIALMAGYILFVQIRTASLPDYSKDIKLPGLSAEVIILRDSFAIPHIVAQNESDLYIATGFAMAQDRLWQMDLLRRITQGRLSEILGAEQVNTDLLMRALRIQEKSEKILAQSNPEIVAALEAFASGVNYYMDNYPLPPEFRILGYKPDYWLPVHSVNLIGYMSWDLASGWQPEILLHQLAREVSPLHLQELLPDDSVHSVPVFPEYSSGILLGENLLTASDELEKLGAQIFYGSNNWAVSGGKSKTGKPLLANDMHLGLFAPGIWLQMHQSVEGSLNVTGLVLPGQPFVICGHNDSVAWGMTNVAVDDIDFYAETLNEDSTKYLLDGKWEDLIIKKEIITTKDGRQIIVPLKFTHRGPLINRFKKEKETVLSMRWMGNELSDEVRTVYLLNRAANWNDFREAVESFRSVSQNIIYADVSGNIGLQTAAGIPLRQGRGPGIYPGDTSLYDWMGYIPFSELPFEFNPRRGYVASANNKTTPVDYPYYIGSWYALPDRIVRICEMLEETEKSGVTDFMQMHADYKSVKAERFVPFFIKALELNIDITRNAAFQKLKEWDYVLTCESQAASVFEVLYRKVAECMLKDELPPDLFQSLMGTRLLIENYMEKILLSHQSAWSDIKTTPEKETLNDIINLAFIETVEELKTHSGEDVEKWNWSKLHTITLSHPLGVVNLLDKALNLNRGPYGVPGSFHTVTPFSYSYTNLYKVNYGASHRHIFDLSDWDNSKTVIPTGTSGIPASDHYLDQLDLYLENLYHADLFHPDEVQKHVKYRMKLLP